MYAVSGHSDDIEIAPSGAIIFNASKTAVLKEMQKRIDKKEFVEAVEKWMRSEEIDLLYDYEKTKALCEAFDSCDFSLDFFYPIESIAVCLESNYIDAMRLTDPFMARNEGFWVENQGEINNAILFFYENASAKIKRCEERNSRQFYDSILDRFDFYFLDRYGEICFVTNEITLQGFNFGRFIIRVKRNHVDIDMFSGNTTVNYHGDYYIHPHVFVDKNLCYGNYYDVYREAMRSGDISEVLNITLLVLNNYNEQDPVKRIEYWTEEYVDD